MPSAHLINRVTILGTGLIGGSFALALRKYTTDIHITGWDRPEVVREAQSRAVVDAAFSAELAPAVENADLVAPLPAPAAAGALPAPCILSQYSTTFFSILSRECGLGATVLAMGKYA